MAPADLQPKVRPTRDSGLDTLSAEPCADPWPKPSGRVASHECYAPCQHFWALRRNSGKPSNIDDSVRWLFWVHSAVDAQRVDCDSVVAGVPGVSARTGRREIGRAAC